MVRTFLQNFEIRLTLSWRRPLSYRNLDWFLYDNGLRHRRVKDCESFTSNSELLRNTAKYWKALTLSWRRSLSYRTGPLICSAHQWTSFYIIGAFRHERVQKIMKIGIKWVKKQSTCDENFVILYGSVRFALLFLTKQRHEKKIKAQTL